MLKPRHAPDVHARVVGEVRFQESHPRAAGDLHQQRQIDDGSRLDQVQIRAKVLPLVAGVEAVKFKAKAEASRAK